MRTRPWPKGARHWSGASRPVSPSPPAEPAPAAFSSCCMATLPRSSGARPRCAVRISLRREAAASGVTGPASAPRGTANTSAARRGTGSGNWRISCCAKWNPNFRCGAWRNCTPAPRSSPTWRRSGGICPTSPNWTARWMSRGIASCGANGRGARRNSIGLVRDAYENLVSDAIPERLKLGDVRLAGTAEGKLRIAAYSEYDPLLIPQKLAAVLGYFDGRPTEDALAAILSEHGLSLQPALVRRMLDFGVLAACERPGAGPFPIL